MRWAEGQARSRNKYNIQLTRYYRSTRYLHDPDKTNSRGMDATSRKRYIRAPTYLVTFITQKATSRPRSSISSPAVVTRCAGSVQYRSNPENVPDHADHTAPTRQHEPVHTYQGSIRPERSRSSSGNRSFVPDHAHYTAPTQHTSARSIQIQTRFALNDLFIDQMEIDYLSHVCQVMSTPPQTSRNVVRAHTAVVSKARKQAPYRYR